MEVHVEKLRLKMKEVIATPGQTHSATPPRPAFATPGNASSHPPFNASTSTEAQTEPGPIDLDELFIWLKEFIHMDTTTFTQLTSDLSAPTRKSAAELKQEVDNKAAELKKLKEVRPGGPVLVRPDDTVLSDVEVNDLNTIGQGRWRELLQLKIEMERKNTKLNKVFEEWRVEDQKFAPLRREKEALEREIAELKKGECQRLGLPILPSVFTSDTNIHKSDTSPEIIQSLQSEIARQIQRISILTQSLSAKDAALQSAQQDIAAKRAQLTTYNNLIARESELKERENVLKEKVASLSRDIKDSDERLWDKTVQLANQAALLTQKDDDIKRLKSNLEQAKAEIATLAPLREEVFERKQERDKARYELEWAQRSIEKLKTEVKDLERTCKAEKKYSAALNKRLGTTWKERDMLIEGLKARENDVAEMRIELANSHVQTWNDEQRISTWDGDRAGQRGSSPPKLSGEQARRQHVNYEGENPSLESSIRALGRKLTAQDHAIKATQKLIDSTRIENAEWEAARLEKARKVAQEEQEKKEKESEVEEHA
jgi:hypothetical protein